MIYRWPAGNGEYTQTFNKFIAMTRLAMGHRVEYSEVEMFPVWIAYEGEK